MLYLVPTPIGNLRDITLRAIDTLKHVEIILAEDTRNTGKLLAHYDIKTPMQSYHAHNEHKILSRIITQLKSGSEIALVTDAGTPAISDPGFLLVRECHLNEIQVTCLPGASALIPALASSGIPCNRFHFEGFLPTKKGRKTRWEYLSKLQETIVLYESPYRLVKTLSEIKEYFGAERNIAVIKEISKIYETIYRGLVSEVIELLEEKPIKGEFVIVIGN